MQSSPASEAKNTIPEPGQTPGKRGRVSALDRVLQVLDFLRDRATPVTAYDLARQLAAPMSTIYTIVDDMVSKGLLTRDDAGLIWLGARLYHYGLAYERATDMLNLAKHAMTELNRALGETIQICGRDGDHMVVLAMAEGSDHFQVTSRVGTRVPLNWTASGRLLVGHLPEEERRRIFMRCSMVSPTGRAQVDPDILSKQSEAALRDRVCVQASESDYAVACIAAPIRNTLGECLATISIVLPEDKARRGETIYAEAVRAAASQIEAAMGIPVGSQIPTAAE